MITAQEILDAIKADAESVARLKRCSEEFNALPDEERHYVQEELILLLQKDARK